MSAAADSGGGVSAADSGGVPSALVELPAVLPPAPRTFGDGAIELRVGRWQDALADVASVDVLITDPPYSARVENGTRSSRRMEVQWKGAVAPAAVGMGYAPIDRDWIFKFIDHWHARTVSWMVVCCDHESWVAYRDAMAACGRYVFAPVIIVKHGAPPRMSCDGPASQCEYMCISRPRQKRFLTWGALPGWYAMETVRALREWGGVRGAKSIQFMRALVRDYSRPGDLICDPCAGGATTLLAAAIEGRRGIGAEMDPATYALACKRLGRGYTPNMFTAARTERAPATQHDLDLGTTTTR